LNIFLLVIYNQFRNNRIETIITLVYYDYLKYYYQSYILTNLL